MIDTRTAQAANRAGGSGIAQSPPGIFRFIPILAAMIIIAGCASVPVNQRSTTAPTPSPPVYHEVKSGETIEQIAAQFRTTPAELAEYNRITTPGKIPSGTVLRIPPPREVAQAPPTETPWWNTFRPASFAADWGGKLGLNGGGTKTDDTCRVQRETAPDGCPPADFVCYDVCARPGDVSTCGYSWPVIGRVTRPFNAKADHRGLDICARTGTPVVAARGGKVLYSDNKLSDYGNVIIIDHGNGSATVYAHNRRNLVKAGQNVTRGQCIAEVGQTGNATAPHVHFEVRSNATPTNPRPYLP